MMKWKADKEIQPDRTVHVWPLEQEREHVLRGTSCECEPIITRYGENLRVVHNAYGEDK